MSLLSIYVGGAISAVRQRRLSIARMYVDDANALIRAPGNLSTSYAVAKFERLKASLKEAREELERLERGEGGTHHPDVETVDPVCPHCGIQDDGWWEWSDIYDDNEFKAQCGSCDGEYTIMVHVRTTFVTKA